jgi:hypothetical protein
MFIPAVGDREPNDLRQKNPADFPSKSYINFLHQANIQKKIGAEVEYVECSQERFNDFNKTGDVHFCLPYL